MARKKLHREPVLKDWAEVNDALRSIHEYEHALTEMGVDMSRRIEDVYKRQERSRYLLTLKVAVSNCTYRVKHGTEEEDTSYHQLRVKMEGFCLSLIHI